MEVHYTLAYDQCLHINFDIVNELSGGAVSREMIFVLAYEGLECDLEGIDEADSPQGYDEGKSHSLWCVAASKISSRLVLDMSLTRHSQRTFPQVCCAHHL